MSLRDRRKYERHDNKYGAIERAKDMSHLRGRRKGKAHKMFKGPE
jgi:hypothetical protein